MLRDKTSVFMDTAHEHIQQAQQVLDAATVAVNNAAEFLSEDPAQVKSDEMCLTIITFMKLYSVCT